MNDYNDPSNRQRPHAIFSINDPRWGRGDGNEQDPKRPDEPARLKDKDKGGEGPPDLDEMWRDFNKKLAGLFGKKPAGGAPRADNGKGAKVLFGVVIGALIALYLGSGVFMVQDGTVGVVSRFGKYQSTTDQGIHWRFPYPFESAEIVDITQIRSVEIGRNNALTQANVRDSSLLTHDADIVNVRFNVQYQIKSATDYLFRNLDPEQSVMEAGQAAIREIAGAHTTDELLFKDREALRAKLVDKIQTSLDAYKTGLQVTGVTLEDVAVPSRVQPSFEEASKVRQDNERAVNTAKAYADQVVPKAKADAATMIDNAKAYSNRVISQAQGDAERFKQVYAEYSKAPAVIRQRMYLDTMQQIYSKATKVFVDSKSSNNVVYLPLDKMIDASKQRTGAAGEVASASAASGAAATNTASNAALASAPAVTSTSDNPATATPTPAASTNATAPAAQDTAPAASSAPPATTDSQTEGDPLRSRDAFRSRAREDDTQ